MMFPRSLVLFILLLACISVHAEPAITEDVIYGHKAGMALTLDVVQPENPNGAGLLYMVSRGWVSDYFPLHDAIASSARSQGRFHVLLERGYTLFMVRHGSAPYFRVPDMVSDVRHAVRYIRANADDWGVDPERLGVFGNSAGGHLALMLAVAPEAGDPNATDPVERVSSEVAACGVYYPPTDLRAIAGNESLSAALGFNTSLAESVSPIAHVSADDPPTLFVHGDKDRTVPLSESETMRAALEEAGVTTEIIVMEGAGHAFPGRYGREAAAALAEWFDEHLQRD